MYSRNKEVLHYWRVASELNAVKREGGGDLFELVDELETIQLVSEWPRLRLICSEYVKEAQAETLAVGE